MAILKDSSQRKLPPIVKQGTIAEGSLVMVQKLKDIQTVPSLVSSIVLESDADFLGDVPDPPKPLDFSHVDHELDRYRQESIAQIRQELVEFRKSHLASIEREKESLLDSAYEEGLAKAKQESDRFFQEKSRTFLASLDDMFRERHQFFSEHHSDLLKLSISVAEHILRSELTQNPQVYLKILEEGLARITDTERVILRVNPEDALRIRDYKTELSHYLSDIRNFSIQEDDSVDRGGCIIETKMGYIDSSVRSKLEMIESAFLSVLSDSTA